MWRDQLLFGQWFEARFGKAGSSYEGRVYNEQLATGAGGTDRCDNIWHHTMRGGSTPSGRQREDRLRFGQFSQIGLLDHVLGANLRGLKTPRTDPPPHRFRVTLCPAGGLWHGQHVAAYYYNCGRVYTDQRVRHGALPAQLRLRDSCWGARPRPAYRGVSERQLRVYLDEFVFKTPDVLAK